MEGNETFEEEKVILLKRTSHEVQFSLPYGWKKFGQKRKNSDHWDFYLISSNNKKFRSNPEVKRYLEKNPNVKCDLSVTNTQYSSDLKKLKKPNPDIKEPESELHNKPKGTPIVPKLLQCSSKKVKSKICKEITPESCDVSELISAPDLDEKLPPDQPFQEKSEENPEISMKRKIKLSNFGKNTKNKGLESLPLEISLESSDNASDDNESGSESDSEDGGDGFKVPNFMGQLKPGKKVPNPFFGGKKSPILSHQNTEYSSESEPNNEEIKIRKSGRMGKAPSRYIEDSESDSDFSTKQSKNVLTEKSEGFKSIKSKSKTKSTNKENDKDLKLNCGIEKKNTLKVPKETKLSEIKSRGFKSSPVSSFADDFSDEESDSENSDEGSKAPIKPKNSKEKTSELALHSTQLMDSITIQYLEKNPNVKCDLSVKSTQYSSDLNKLEKPDPDIKEPESKLLVKPKVTPVVPKLLQCSSKNVKSKICKETTPESCNVSSQLMDSIEADEEISKSGQIVKAPSISPPTQKLQGQSWQTVL